MHAPRALTALLSVSVLFSTACADGGEADGSSPPTDSAPVAIDASDGSAAVDSTTTPDAEAGVAADAASDATTDAASDATTDAASDAAVDGATCAPVTAAPDVDAWSMRPKSPGFGAITEATVGTHQDVFLDSPTKYIRIGARLDWGGTVVFFGLTANPASNVIDANDTGRELQLALYAPTRIKQPCAATASCVGSTATCGDSITFLGWNPVQGGDECNHGAPVLSHGKVGDALELVVQPLQWNPDWDAPDCRKSACTATGRKVDVTYRMRLRFVREHVVEVDTEVKSSETFGHPSTEQEWPTLYVGNGAGGAPDLPLLLDAAGVAPAIATPANDGFYVGNFTSPAPWVTWQNATKDYGVGLEMDQGVTAFQGWRGDGSKAPYFHNVRARVAFGIGAGATVRGMSHLALGSFATVKTELEAAEKARGPFGHVDQPAAAITFVKGTPLRVAGWALDNRAGTTIDVLVDGVKAAGATITVARADVCAVYPGYVGCPKAGFDVSIPTDGWSACPHLVRVVARDADGNEQVLGERVASP
ncbi:MAG: hypothetical protein HYV09_24245 [Deltaproteobacteria bacterium]|nr:hypothetical protein [Deltaproteobacteria bacterium]